ncbi:unnamed protein product [Dimorphilus gyrociliatus]|uniref:Uncharacterized protein n=1 Tax=Dimorphilus gyrociliatus TaxID=2664684 RepID=A0A7I8WDK4_9ANNE|nr:unnamed protein product [Dimorphilus gyrociliatus]
MKVTSQYLFKSLLSSAKTLKILRINDCKLKVDGSNRLKKLLEKCQSLCVFTLNNNNSIKEERMMEIFQSLQSLYSNTISTLDFSGCNLSIDCVKGFWQLFKSLTNPQSIILSGNGNVGNNLHIFFEDIQPNQYKLQYLNISKCSMRNYFIADNVTQYKKFQIFLMEKFCLNDLNFMNTFYTIHFENCSDLNKFSHNANLFTSFTRLYDENDSDFLQKLILSSSTIQSLKFNSCNIDERYGNSLADVLEKCPNLREIDIGNNKNIGNSLGKIFQSLETSSHNLKILNLYNCPIITIEELSKLSELLANCHFLEDISLTFHLMENENEELIEEDQKLLSMIFEHLKSCSENLTIFHLSGSISQLQIDAIASFLMECKHLKTLTLEVEKEIKFMIENKIVEKVSTKNFYDLKFLPWIHKANTNMFSSVKTEKPEFNMDPNLNKNRTCRKLVELVRKRHLKYLNSLKYLPNIANCEDIVRNVDCKKFFDKLYMQMNLFQMKPYDKRQKDVEYLTSNFKYTLDNCIVGSAQIGKTQLLNRLLYLWVNKKILQNYLLLRLSHDEPLIPSSSLSLI